LQPDIEHNSVRKERAASGPQPIFRELTVNGRGRAGVKVMPLSQEKYADDYSDRKKHHRRQYADVPSRSRCGGVSRQARTLFVSWSACLCALDRSPGGIHWGPQPLFGVADR
jgi:hypothetical protein